mmetsp:Transcript_78653/g.254813  ORF Transcript_78653/g.254813 Transcript_78653/m.254813 type:complete len:239 (+) Transcript_78653:638-1354(+)
MLPRGPGGADVGLHRLRVGGVRGRRRHAGVDDEAGGGVCLAVALAALHRYGEEGQHHLAVAARLRDVARALLAGLGLEDVGQHRRGHHKGPLPNLDDLAGSAGLLGQRVEARGLGGVVAEAAQGAGPPHVRLRPRRAVAAVAGHHAHALHGEDGDLEVRRQLVRRALLLGAVLRGLAVGGGVRLAHALRLVLEGDLLVVALHAGPLPPGLSLRHLRPLGRRGRGAALLQGLLLAVAVG